MGWVYRVFMKYSQLADEQYDLGIEFCYSLLSTRTDFDKEIKLYNLTESLYDQKAASLGNVESQRRSLTLIAIKHEKLKFEEMQVSSPCDYSMFLCCIINLAKLQSCAGRIDEAQINYKKN
ncbi:unnamed protein product [Adineta ricciae]|uniref:Uncharacterized protein n=1 Tax=Adineta ricciae TaxID=249248 RepID=A0A815H3W0_ADIRI|nr:unnamed protein product [Adineta ricciae]